ncbi:MAG: hypothetical protein QOJ90_455 [Actinomycetota bacterium]|nr:hypothetical protein [Actinomycetota bacterium]
MTDSNGFGRRDVARCWAGFASLGAGLVHVAVVREHFSEYWLFGAFFAALAAVQLAWGLAALARPTVPAPRLINGLTVGVILLWLVSRSTGLPLGPDPWTPEPFGRADLLCTVLEVAMVLLVLVAVRRRSPGTVGRSAEVAGSAATGSARLVALLGAGALVVAAVATPAMAATEAGAHAHPHFSSH